MNQQAKGLAVDVALQERHWELDFKSGNKISCCITYYQVAMMIDAGDVVKATVSGGGDVTKA